MSINHAVRSRTESPATPRRKHRPFRPDLPSCPRLTVDEALIALLIGAMDANHHVSAEEAERAHHIIWSMKRFRDRPGETVDRLIVAMRTLIELHGSAPVISAAVHAIPARLRSAAFAVCADLVLADGKLEGAEHRFLTSLGRELGLQRTARDRTLDVLLVKNSA